MSEQQETGPEASAKDDAPGRTAKHEDFGGYKVGGRSVTIREPRETVFDRISDPAVLNLILGGKLHAQVLPNGHLGWRADGEKDGGIETQLVNRREGELLSWRSVEDAELDLEVTLHLRDAPGDRGTEVELVIAYHPRLGTLGHMFARLKGEDPFLLGRQAMKRLKMLMETGEIATAGNRRDN